ncbi:MAG: hypothetical protein GYB31_07015 [Bacteroidetes bacterium]|nr:hypothetical protein [Bacteroidota bacterium]
MQIKNRNSIPDWLRKSFVAISLICLLFSQFKDLSVQLVFHFQQEKLTETSCINRFTPSLDCFANCQLSQMLDEVHEEEKEGLHTNAPDLQGASVFLIPAVFSLSAKANKSQNQPLSYSTRKSGNFFAAVFHPPRIVLS